MKVIVLSCRCRLTELVPNVRQHSAVAAQPVMTSERSEDRPLTRLTAEPGQRGLDRLPSAA